MPTAARTLKAQGGKSVVTTMTDDEMLAVLRSMGDKETFARDLLDAYARNGRLTDSQLVWGHVLAVRAVASRTVNLSRVLTMFRAATSPKSSWPKLQFKFGAHDITLSLAGPRSRYAGGVIITDGRSFRQNQFFGAIDVAGVFSAGRDCHPEVTAFLERFNSDPAAVISEYGRRTGECIFCAMELKDECSVHVGFGPHCAKVWGLKTQWEAAAKEFRAKKRLAKNAAKQQQFKDGDKPMDSGE